MKLMYKSAALAAALILTAGISVQAQNFEQITTTGHGVNYVGGVSLVGGHIDATMGLIDTVQSDTVTADSVISKDITAQNQLNANKAVVVDLNAETLNVNGKDVGETLGAHTTAIQNLQQQTQSNLQNITQANQARIEADQNLQGQIDTNASNIGALDNQINGDNGLQAQVDTNSEAIEGLRQKVDTDTVNADTVNAGTVNAGTVNGDSLSMAGGKFQVAENGDVYAQNGKSQFQVRDDYLGMNYGTNTYIGLNEDGVSISSKGYQIDGATGDIATDGTLSVGQGANINGGLAVSGGANINGGLTVDGMDVGGSIAQNTADIQKNTAAINQETADRTAADQILQQGIQNNSNAISSLNSRVSDLGGEIDNVGAISAALAGLHPLDYDGTGSKFQLAAAMGNYDGSQAAAIGGFYHFNEDVMMSVGGATAFDGDKKAAFNVGVSFRVGSGSSAKRLNSDDVIAQLTAMNDKIVALEAENQKLTEKVAALQDSEAAPKA